MASTDPIWQNTQAGAFGDVGTCYGGGVWLFTQSLDIGAADWVWRSEDGKTWQKISLPRTGDWINILYVGGLFLLIEGYHSASLTYFTSPNGLWWTERQLPNASFWMGASAPNGVAILLPHNDETGALISLDGTNWLIADQNQMGAVNSSGSAYGNGTYLSYSSNTSSVYSSTDLVNWLLNSAGDFNCFFPPVFGNNVFVGGAGSSYLVRYSPDGLSWETAATESGVTLSGAFNSVWDEAGGQFVCLPTDVGSTPVTNQVWTSQDGAIWRESSFPFSGSRPRSLTGISNDTTNDKAQIFVVTSNLGVSAGTPPRIRGKRFIPHNFTKIIQVQS